MHGVRRGLIGALLLAAAAVTAPVAALAQRNCEQSAAVCPDGQTATLLNGTQVALDPAAADAIEAALADPNAPGAAEALQEALASAGAESSTRIAGAAACAAAGNPTLASVIARAAIKAQPEAAGLIGETVSAVRGVEPNRIAAAIDAYPTLSPDMRQAALDGVDRGGRCTQGPPDRLPTLPQEALRSPVIDSTENPAQDNVSPVQ